MADDRSAEQSIGQRLALLLRDLGVEQAHLVVGSSSEPVATDLLSAAPEVAATVTLVLPMRAVDQFRPFADRLQGIFEGSAGRGPFLRRRDEVEAWPGVTSTRLPDDAVPMLWSDTPGDHHELLLDRITSFAASAEAPALSRASAQGVEHRNKHRNERGDQCGHEGGARRRQYGRRRQDHLIRRVYCAPPGVVSTITNSAHIDAPAMSGSKPTPRLAPEGSSSMRGLEAC